LDVYWLEQSLGDVPAGDNWLSPDEALRQSSLRFPRRRADWRLGRWTAKRAVAARLNMPTHAEALASIRIHAAPDGAPEVTIANQLRAVTISLSHRGGFAICAVARSGALLGCDLELIEPRSDAFIADYFTPEEQALLARASGGARYRLLAMLWSGKESALKALRAGLRLDTRALTVSFPEAQAPNRDGWFPLHVQYRNDRALHGDWQDTGGLVRTLVADPPPDPPIRLEISATW
jgi:4'-phosphopantetheinyl transferase